MLEAFSEKDALMITSNFYKKIIPLGFVFLITLLACSDKSTEIENSTNEQTNQQISKDQSRDSQSAVSNTSSKSDKNIDPIPVDPFIPVIDTSGANWNPLTAEENARVLSPPDANQIKLEYDEIEENVRVIANPGAVPADASVMVVNLELGQVTVVRADSSGAFQASVPASLGTHILIKQDSIGGHMTDTVGMFGEGPQSPGIILSIPGPKTENVHNFAGGARISRDGPAWIVEGNLSKIAFQANDNATVQGKISIVADISQHKNINYSLSGELIGDENGLQVGPANFFLSNILTPTGFPIIPGRENSMFFNADCSNNQLDWKQVKNKFVSNFSCEINIDTSWLKTGTPTGTYIIWLNLHFPETMHEMKSTTKLTEELFKFGRMGGENRVPLATVTVGSPKPMKLITTLFADLLQEGTRGGILSREDLSLIGISSPVITNHNPIIPRVDSYGDSWKHRLDPYVPLLGITDRAPPAVPFIDFDFLNSQMQITIERPDGKTDILGPGILGAYGVKTPILPGNEEIAAGGGHIGEIPQLLGLQDEFEYEFPLDGDYVVKLSGYVFDSYGHKFEISGTYDLTVANSLDIETELLPGTPFEIGNSLPVGLYIYPQVSADVNFKVTHVGADNVVTVEEYKGTANEFGYWDGNGEYFTFEKPGEYKVETEARYTDKDGNLWVGRMVYGSVIATENAPIVAHGIRGPDNIESIPPPWGFGSDFESGGHHHFPFFTGDILWGIEDSEPNRNDEDMGPGDSVVTGLTFQSLDPKHPLVARVIEQAQGTVEDLDSLVEAGEIPLTTIPEKGPDGNPSGAFRPEEFNLRGYSYNSAQRPGVRVRELVQAGDAGKTYWRFNDAYHMQSGNSSYEGDMPGEFKFLYGGAVMRDIKLKEAIFAIYGSGWVLLNRNDPQGSRFMPPFQGNAGGPNGGPLFNIHGRDIDMFFLPLGIRPAAILDVGDVFKMAGSIMPTLPSKVAYTVTSPDGTSRTFEGQANSIGYYYNPSDDFTLEQSGLWTVELKVIHDGMTSAGPVQEPYPNGGLLTPDGRTFTFVVKDVKTHELTIGTDLIRNNPLNWYASINQARFATVLPEEWNAEKAHIIVTMPGIVLLDKDIVIEDGTIDFVLNGKELNQLVSNFDPNLSDTITVTYYVKENSGRQAVASIVTHGARVPIGSDLPPNIQSTHWPTGQTNCLATEKQLFSDDFESGSKQWEFSDDTAWSIVELDGSNVLKGSGHVHAFAGDKWNEVVWRMRLKLTTESTTHLNFHASEGKRYLISFNKDGTHILVDDFMLAAAGIKHSLEDWHIVEISRIDNVLRVAVDNILEIEQLDSNPLPPGRIWIESLDDTVLFLDDVNVCAPTSNN